MFDGAGRGDVVVLPVRPVRDVNGDVEQCLRGHYLRVAGTTRGYHTPYDARLMCCLVCQRQHDERASWCLVNPARQVSEPGVGLTLVATPPAVRGGVGRIAVHIGHTAVADIDIAACGPCARACVEQIRADPSVRRRGFATLLVAAALARAPSPRYRWSTTSIDDTPAARAFWASVPFPGALGTPDYCRDMLTAMGQQVDF